MTKYHANKVSDKSPSASRGLLQTDVWAALNELYERGARFVLAGSKPAQTPSKGHPNGIPETPESQRGKIPLYGGWRTARPTASKVFEHLRARGFKGDNTVGLIPRSLGLTVVDCDQPEHAADLLKAVGTPLLKIPSRHADTGHFHAYYKAPQVSTTEEQIIVENKKWAGGELRGDNGHFVLWQLEKTAAAILSIFNDESRPFMEQWESVQALRIDDIPGIRWKSKRRTNTTKSETIELIGLPDAFTTEQLEELWDDHPPGRAMFYQEPTAEQAESKSDFTSSGWDASLATMGLRLEQDDDWILGLLRAYNFIDRT